MKVVKQGDPLTIHSVNVLLYGYPGTYKTSIGQTAKNPITLAFDPGIKRSDFARDYILISTWGEIVWSDFKKELMSHDTFVVDTVDKALTAIKNYVIQKDSRLSQPKYTMMMYGKILDTWREFYSNLQSYKKDIIMIAHAKEVEEGKAKIRRPKIMGQTREDIEQDVDMIGFVTTRNDEAYIDYNTHDEDYKGKNCCGLEPHDIPNFNEVPDYYEKQLDFIRKALQKKNNSFQDSKDSVEEYSLQIEKLITAKQFNSFMASMPNDLMKPVRKQIWTLLSRKAEEMDFIYHSEDKEFVSKEIDKPTTEKVSKPKAEAKPKPKKRSRPKKKAKAKEPSPLKSLKELNKYFFNLDEDLSDEAMDKEWLYMDEQADILDVIYDDDKEMYIARPSPKKDDDPFLENKGKKSDDSDDEFDSVFPSTDEM